MHDAVASLRAAGVAEGDLVALAVAPGVGAGLAGTGSTPTLVPLRAGTWTEVVAAVERDLRPRWALWSGATAAALVAAGVRVARAWDVASVHRLLEGGWRADPGVVWAVLHDLPTESVPDALADDLFSVDLGDGAEPVRGDGHLDPGWVRGDRLDAPERLARWAALALEAARRQRARLAAGPGAARAAATARAESTAELLCAELAADGLPVDRAEAEALLATIIGPRPGDDAEAEERRAARDDEVLRLAGVTDQVDLRSTAQVRSLLRSVGVEVPDTRAWRLERHRDEHPVVAALLRWRKAERVATTYGYRWLEQHVGADGRLRGSWTSSDGAAGRMTASAGLHNLPAALRAAVIAEPGHVLVRADLGQIEPRVLAAIAADPALARATADDDLYAPVARALGVERATAKVAVLGAMYGQTTGHGADALRALRAAYPVAMAHLDQADAAAQGGHDLRTYGGRRIRMGVANAHDVDERQARAQAAARGRYGRNALVQGAAAELFKVWAVTVRARLGSGARIVLCLHDELLVHAPEDDGAAVAAVLHEGLQEAAARWAPGAGVRFVADVAVVRRWSDAKA